MRKDGKTSPCQVILKNHFKNTSMKHPQDHNTHHMSSPQRNTAKMPMTISPQMKPQQSPRKNKENPRRSGQHPVLRSQCRLHLPGRPRHHCNTKDKRNIKHPKKNGRVFRLRGDTPRRENTVQSIINDSPDTHGCILYI